MRLIRQFFNILKQGFVGIWRNKGMSFTSTISIAAMLTLFGIVFLTVLNLNALVYQTGEKLDKVVFYFYDDAANSDINEFIKTLDADSQVRSVNFVSREEALREFTQKYEDLRGVFEALPGGNPLPASVTVEVKKLSYGKDVKDRYKDYPVVEDEQYLYDFVNKMIKVESGVKYVGSAIVAILLLVSILIINNTIKIAVSNRSREINIMKYVGATNSYIRGPFLIEGVFFGVLASVIASFLTKNLYGYLYEKISSELQTITNFNLVNYSHINFDMFIIFLAIGIGIGYLGSLISTKRFLNV